MRYIIYGHYRPKLWQKKQHKKGCVSHWWQCSTFSWKFSDVINYVMLCYMLHIINSGIFYLFPYHTLRVLPPIVCYLLLWNGKTFQPPKPYPNKSYIFQSSINTSIQDPTLNGTHNTPTVHYFKLLSLRNIILMIISRSHENIVLLYLW